MTQKEFKVGDRVVVNNKTATHQGRKGIVKYASGGLFWLKFDNGDEVTSGFYPWWLDPLTSKDEVAR